ncbi:hypothetical protein IW262DRAFT_1559698 [Armillaria fumosa]|nr:hypothetical protein IW262DRAFT_1559698 [Armillaria fumosa]
MSLPAAQCGLSAELIDTIIDYVASTNRHSHMTHAVLSSYTMLSFENHESFMRFIASPNCSFLGSIRRLTLVDNPDYDFANLWLHEILPATDPSIFSGIKWLHIHYATFNSMSEEDFSQTLISLSGFTSITHLDLDRCIFLTLDNVIHFLTSCGALASARLHRVKLVEGPPEVATESYLAQLPASLSSLIFIIGGGPSYILGIVPYAGASLKHLSVTFTVDTDILWRSLNLESIAFRIVPGCRPSLVWHIPDILRKLSSPSLHEITVSFWMNSVDTLDALEWKPLTEILSQEHYKNLKRFSVLATNMYLDVKTAKEWITYKLRALADKNPSLEIEFVRWKDPFEEGALDDHEE